MNLKYINKIKANIAIYSNKKTSNILDGTYKSIYRGKSMLLMMTLKILIGKLRLVIVHY